MSVILLILKIVLCIGIVLDVLGLINKPFSIYAFDRAQRNPLEGQAVVFIEDVSDGAMPMEYVDI